jgi:hypothetical protein
MTGEPSALTAWIGPTGQAETDVGTDRHSMKSNLREKQFA